MCKKCRNGFFSMGEMGNNPSPVFLTPLAPSPTAGQGCYLPFSWVLLHHVGAQTARSYCLVQAL